VRPSRKGTRIIVFLACSVALRIASGTSRALPEPWPTRPLPSPTTTIAANLADALCRLSGKKVAVVDLVLSHGDVTMFFNVNSSYSILDLAKNAEKADYDFLHTLLVRHASGVYVLADPPTIEDGEHISPAQVREVLSTLRSMFDYIIVDTPHQFDERTLTALEMSDIVLLVSLLNLPSLKNTQKCLELFGRIGLRDDGRGLFRKVHEDLGLDDPDLAPLELAKGGAGVSLLLAARAAGAFTLTANGLRLERRPAREGWALSAAPARPGTPISSNMSSTGPGAPPCSGPFRAQSAASTEEMRPARVDATTRAVKVEALKPWSAMVAR